MFALWILPQMLPHLEVYGQVLLNKTNEHLASFNLHNAAIGQSNLTQISVAWKLKTLFAFVTPQEPSTHSASKGK